MKDGVFISLVGVVLIGCVGWLVMRANGIRPFESDTVVVQPEQESSTLDPEPGVPEEPKPVVKKIKTEIPKEIPVVAYHEVAVVDSTPVRALRPAAPPPAPPPFPSNRQIKPGVEKSRITQLFGNPALTVTTGDHGHTFDTFVYNRDRSEVVTIIRFEDGRVSSARTIP